MSKHLLLDKRYWPSFWTMFFGAFNDNVFKNALVILITYKAYKVGGLSPDMMVALCGGIFILPFFLFSSTAGQICDKYPKHKLMVFIKVWEILVMLMGAYGFVSEQIGFLIFTLFLMGFQSSIFGPVKYSIIPEIVNDDELVQGNAYFSMGTFLSILLGTILGGVLIAVEGNGKVLVAIAVVCFAIIGTLFSLRVNPLKAGVPDLKIDWIPITSAIDILKITKKTRGVFLAVLGISWFWFLGAALLSMFPGFAKDYLDGNEHVVTLLLALFSIGVAVGSIICEKLSRDGLELGLVPLGTFGMSAFILDLFIRGGLPIPVDNQSAISVTEFLSTPGSFRVLFDLMGLSIFSGFFTVPLYTYVQKFSSDGERSRVIAGLNIINALFMVVSAVFLTLLYAWGLTMPQVFGVLAIMNLLVALYIYTVIPEYLLRFFAKVLLKFIYRLKVTGQKNIPEEGGCILTCNHVSFVDWLILYGAIRRPVRFIMHYKFMKIPLIGFLFKDAGVIPIAGRKEDPEILAKAMDEIEAALKNGDILCIFPEGAITYSGELEAFKPGIERMLSSAPVPVIPMTLHGLWGSFFSRKYGKALSNPSVIIKRWLSRVEVRIYEPWAPENVSAEKIEEFTRSKL